VPEDGQLIRDIEIPSRLGDENTDEAGNTDPNDQIQMQHNFR
jgi:hypothetical protein